MATSTIKNELKFTTIRAKLSELTWHTSGSGKHYASIGDLPNSHLRTVAIIDWGYWRETDLIEPVLNGIHVDIISNTDTFANVNAYIEVVVGYL